MKTNLNIEKNTNRFVLPEGLWQGYVWKSDSQKPEVFLGTENHDDYTLTDGENPFVVEAQLVIANQSYSIKYIDGQYHIYRYDLTSYDKIVNDDIVADVLTYAPNKMPDVVGLRFLRVWRKKESEEFSALAPAEMVFLGLNLKK